MHWSSAAGMKSRWLVSAPGPVLSVPIPERRGSHQHDDGEGFWSIIKRGVLATFHKVSKKYIPLYVAEFQFRHDNRTSLEKSVAQI
jgi:hypothetical protein